MSAFFDFITDEQAALIRGAPLFFVASAPADAGAEGGNAFVNVSPKGGAPLHILGPNRVAYLDYRGSGNETAAHAASGGRVTVMICSFEEGDAAIVRLYGRARVTPFADSALAARLAGESEMDDQWPPRQVIEITVERTMTSCGYGVPVMRKVRERHRADRGRRYKHPG